MRDEWVTQLEDITRKGDDDQLMRPDEAAKMLAVSPRTLERWASEGRVRKVKLGGVLRFRLGDVRQFIRESRE